MMIIDRSAILCTSLLLCCVGCSTEPSEEEAVSIAFEAIRNTDTDAFQAASITGSEYVLKDSGVKRMAQKKTFLGGVLKKEEQEHAIMQFHTAREGWHGYIDFDAPSTEFAGLGKLIWQGKVPHLNGVEIPAKIYSAKVKDKIGEHDDIPPYFQVVKWGSFYRIMGLKFPHQNAQEAADAE